MIMSFGGAVSAMITSLKNNRRTRRSTFDKLKIYEKTTYTKVEYEKKSSPELLKEIREKLQKENKKNFIFTLTFTVVLTVVLFILFYYVKF